ncbi:AAA family ATPase [Cellulomonas sp. URHB0016]
MSGTPQIRSGAWLDEQTFPALSWAVPGIIPEGFGLFTGPPKVGKSWATLDIVLAVAAGGDALGSVPVGDPRPVLLLALEDGDRRLQSRCRKLLGTEPIPNLLDYATNATPGDIIPLIEGWLDEHPDTRPLVVLDTLGKVSPPAQPGESAYARDYRIGGALKRLTDAHPGAALLVVHHVRKATSDDWMDSTSGTNGLNGAADFTVSLSRSRNDTDGVLRVTGRDVPEGEYALTVSDGSWRIQGSSLADAALAAQQAKATEGLSDRSADIIEFVGRHPDGVGPSAVAEAVGITAKAASTYLGRLVGSDRIRNPSRGLYIPVGSVGVWASDVTETHTPTETTPTSHACDECGEPLDGPGFTSRCRVLHGEAA